jgi:hypothetical protein
MEQNKQNKNKVKSLIKKKKKKENKHFQKKKIMSRIKI